MNALSPTDHCAPVTLRSARSCAEPPRRLGPRSSAPDEVAAPPPPPPLPPDRGRGGGGGDGGDGDDELAGEEPTGPNRHTVALLAGFGLLVLVGAVATTNDESRQGTP